MARNRYQEDFWGGFTTSLGGVLLDQWLAKKQEKADAAQAALEKQELIEKEQRELENQIKLLQEKSDVEARRKAQAMGGRTDYRKAELEMPVVRTEMMYEEGGPGRTKDVFRHGLEKDIVEYKGATRPSTKHSGPIPYSGRFSPEGGGQPLGETAPAKNRKRQRNRKRGGGKKGDGRYDRPFLTDKKGNKPSPSPAPTPSPRSQSARDRLLKGDY
jgi:hypothetical protein